MPSPNYFHRTWAQNCTKILQVISYYFPIISYSLYISFSIFKEEKISSMLKFEGGEHQEISSIPFHFSARDLRKELKSLIFLHIILTCTFFLKNNQLTIKFCYTSVLQKYSIFTGLLTKVFVLGNTAFNKMCFYNIFLVAIWRQQKINLNFFMYVCGVKSLLCYHLSLAWFTQ